MTYKCNKIKGDFDAHKLCKQKFSNKSFKLNSYLFGILTALVFLNNLLNYVLNLQA